MFAIKINNLNNAKKEHELFCVTLRKIMRILKMVFALNNILNPSIICYV